MIRRVSVLDAPAHIIKYHHDIQAHGPDSPPPREGRDRGKARDTQSAHRNSFEAELLLRYLIAYQFGGHCSAFFQYPVALARTNIFS